MSLLLNTLANVTPVLAQAADAVAETSTKDLPFFEQKALIYAAAFMSIGFAAIGSAYGCGSASCAAMGAWKKCYAQNKPAPFQLLIFAGAPLSQTIYGMIVMFIVMGGASNVALSTAGNWIVYSLVGVLVHAVRLNTLEFSNHMGLQWAGFKFKPFSAKQNNN